MGSLFALLSAGSLVRGQTTRAQVGVDPYTSGKPEALAKAGYVSFGPFPFGEGYTTGSITNLLGTEPLIWIETAHFRLGCALSPVALKGRHDWSREWNKLLKAELKELRKVIPGIKKKVKVLDPWLRAHLMAWRLEKLYAEVLANLGLRDEWFPKQSSDPQDAEKFRGLGPYFGMKEKFTVLLLQQAASHARYTRAYHGIEIKDPIRYHDIKFSCMYWGGSEETANGLYRIDLALHTNLTFNIAHNLYTCYRAYGHDLPAWVSTGLSHWHARRVSPRFPTYDRRDDNDGNARSAFWEWDKRVKGLVKNEVFEPLETFMDHEHSGKFGLEQHMQAWALVDYLLTTRKAATFRFLHSLKEPFHARRRVPSSQELRIRQRDAFRDAFDCEPAEMQVQWRKFVLGKRGR